VRACKYVSRLFNHAKRIFFAGGGGIYFVDFEIFDLTDPTEPPAAEPPAADVFFLSVGQSKIVEQ